MLIWCRRADGLEDKMIDVTKIKLLSDRVILKIVEKKSTFGFVFSAKENNKDGFRTGEVVAAGKGGYITCKQCKALQQCFPTDVKVGDTVLFKKHDFQVIDDGLIELYSRDLIGVIEE